MIVSCLIVVSVQAIYRGSQLINMNSPTWKVLNGRDCSFEIATSVVGRALSAVISKDASSNRWSS